MDIWQFIFDTAMFWIFALFTYALLRWVMHGFEMKMPGEDED